MNSLKKSQIKNNSSNICPISGLPIKYFDEWEDYFISRTYSFSFRIIGDRILWVIPVGVATPLDMKKYLDKRSEFISQNDLISKNIVEIKDYSKISDHVNYETRKIFSFSLLKDTQNNIIKGYIGFNAHNVVKIMFNVGILLYGITSPVKIVSDYDTAVKQALEILEDKNSNKLKNNKIKITDNISQEKISDHIKELSNFIDGINWKLEGLRVNKYDDDNLFKPIYESLYLIKYDFDNILKENKVNKEELERKNRFNQIRADIWEIASDTKKSQQKLIQEILNRVGSKLAVSRACYNKFYKGNKSEENYVKCVLEWTAHNVKPTIGEKLPLFIIKKFNINDIEFLTLNKAIERINPKFRAIAAPSLKFLAVTQNLKSIIISPYFANSKLKGWFTLDICNNNPNEIIFDEELKNILRDVIKILSITYEKKHAEKELERSYNLLEKHVEERTNELCIKTNMLIEKDNELIEKNNIVETCLDILSHDTKNIFVNLYTLLDQEEKSQMTELLKENIDELFDFLMETAGIMKSKKRIFYLVDFINKIRVTKDRLFIKDCDRFIINYNSTHSLFVETSVLFKNALTNIIENALKYSPADKKVEISICSINDEILIQIKDYGKGIPDNEKEKVFKKHYRMKNTSSIEGSGRGLWIAQNIINMIGAKITISDNEPNGAIFTITIPSFKVTDLNESLEVLSDWFTISLAEIKQKAETLRTYFIIKNSDEIKNLDTAVFTELLLKLREENRKKKEGYLNNKLSSLTNKNPNGKTVIIVDNSVYVHLYLVNYFNDMGFNVLGFGKTGEDAIMLYKKYKPELITLDLTMPIMSGTEAANKLFRIDNKVKILFITAVAEINKYKDEMNELPSINYKVLSKPINKQTLIESVNNLLNFV